MKVRLTNAADAESLEPKWYTYLDEGDGEPVEMLIAPWTRQAQEQIDRNLKNKAYIDGLAIDWSKMPKLRGSKKEELRLVVTADYLVRGMNNFESYDGTTVFKRRGDVGDDHVGIYDEVDIYNKVMAWESLRLAKWIMDRAQEAGARVVEDEAGN